MEPTLVMYGADWCSDCRRAKSFLEANNIDYVYKNIELDEGSVRRVETINHGKRIIPTFEILGQTYTNPDNAQLGCILGINDAGRVLFYGADWCSDCRRAKAYLNDHHVNYQFIDVDVYDWATEEVERINNGKRIIPTIVIDGTPYSNPDNPTLQRVLRLDEEETPAHVYDVVIIGGGAAGLTTAIYTQREKLSSLILEKKNVGGNAFLTDKIENYPGFVDISGPDLMQRMADQATTYGTVVKEGVEVTGIRREGGVFQIETNSGVFEGHAVVLAVGSTYKRLHIPGEDELVGAGIHFCATCDGPFYRGKEIIVVGGGNSALEEGLYLTEFTDNVSFVVRKPAFSASEIYVDKLADRDNVTTYLDKTSLEFLADDRGLFKALKVQDNETGDESLIEADGVFIFIGLTPNTAFLEGIVDLDERGFIVTKNGSVETSVPGIFAAGDCRQGAIAQIASATGEGVLASFGVKEFLKRAW